MPQELLDHARTTLRLRHYSPRTEASYLHWIRRFILFHDQRHPSHLATHDIETFLSSLAIDHHVSAATQNQALSALLFLYRSVLNLELDLPTQLVARPSLQTAPHGPHPPGSP